ncbi:mucin-5AC-like [Haliotis cracherodii]|uniref:mucin-5AC-like n=1 Tax=Haliotis cracherodii TaxID=6455 RepID=UPI0039ECDAAC
MHNGVFIFKDTITDVLKTRKYIRNKATMKLLMVILVHSGLTSSLPTTPVKYTLYAGYKTWNEVYAICQVQGQNMLTLNTLTKYNNFQEINAEWRNNSQMTNDYWTGLHQSEPNNTDVSTLRWSTDCEPLGWVIWGGSNEPDYLADHRCVRLRDAGPTGFMTRVCSARYQIVCEEYTGVCSFEMIKLRKTSGLTFLWETAGMTIQECMDACRNYSSGSEECVAFHQLASSGGTPFCQFYGRESVFVKSNPSLVADSEAKTYVKRCIEGVYAPKAPKVAANNDMAPVVVCNSSVDETSSVFHSVSTQTQLLSISPTPTPVGPSSLLTTPLQDLTSPLVPSVHVTVDPSFQSTYASVQELTSPLVPSVDKAFESSFQSMSMQEMTSPLIPSVNATVDPSFQSTYASEQDMTSQLMPSVHETFTVSVFDASPVLEASPSVSDWEGSVQSMGSDSNSNPSLYTKAPNPHKDPTSLDSKTSSDDHPVHSSIPDGKKVTMTTLKLKDASLAPTESSVYEVTLCTCSCKDDDNTDLDEMDLAVDRKKMSAYRRSKTSAVDDRPSAKAIGSTGIAILVSVFVFIVCMDLDMAVKFIQHIFKKRSTGQV